MGKTIIKKLIEELEYRMKEDKNIDADQLIYNLNILLEQEREMIINAYNAGLVNGCTYSTSGREYYQNNFVSNDLTIKTNK